MHAWRGPWGVKEEDEKGRVRDGGDVRVERGF